MKKLLVLSIVLLTTGCSSLAPGLLDNRALCTVAGDKAYVASLYGPIGITSSLSDKDAVIICAPKSASAASTASTTTK